MADAVTRSWRQRALAGSLAGIVGGLAHASVNELDIRILRHDADDLTLLGGTISRSRVPARRIGLAMHLGFAAMFGATYAVVLQPHDRADALRKGIGAALAEHMALYPLVFPLERFHPYIRYGRLDRFAHPAAFVQATVRHLALGTGIGLSYPFFANRLQFVALDVRESVCEGSSVSPSA